MGSTYRCRGEDATRISPSAALRLSSKILSIFMEVQFLNQLPSSQDDFGLPGLLKEAQEPGETLSPVLYP